MQPQIINQKLTKSMGVWQVLILVRASARASAVPLFLKTLCRWFPTPSPCPKVDHSLRPYPLMAGEHPSLPRRLRVHSPPTHPPRTSAQTLVPDGEPHWGFFRPRANTRSWIQIRFSSGGGGFCMLTKTVGSTPCCLQQLLKLLTEHRVQKATHCRLKLRASLDTTLLPVSHAASNIPSQITGNRH